MTFIEKAAAAYRSGKYRSMAAAMKAMSKKSKTRSNPKSKAKAKSKAKKSSATSRAAKAMRLYQSGKARSLKSAWSMV